MGSIAPLVGWDWAVIVAFLVVSLAIGLYYSRRATGSLTEYFVAGRKMTWWLAGTSIVATSFAADTPLVICGWIRTWGLERNWFWWGGIMGMMLCTYFYARLWRRANLITDVEFNELRYAGRPAAGLRMFHATYRSLIQNTLVMGWVTLAMAKIIDVTLDIPTLVFVHGELLPTLVSKAAHVHSVVDSARIMVWPIVGEAIIPAKATGIIVCLGLSAFYTALSGLWGVMVTDLFQFSFAMTGVFILMIVAFVLAGGPTAMVVKARDAVQNGIIINRAPYPRDRILPTQLPDDLRTKEKSIALLATGLFEPVPEQERLIRWKPQGYIEEEVRARLTAARIGPVDDLVTLWRDQFTINKGKFTDFDAVSRMLNAGILVHDDVAPGRKTDYYRVADNRWSDEQLIAQLESAGVRNKGEMMAAWHKDRVVTPAKITSFLPPFDLKGGGLLAVWSLVVFLGLQWWAGGEGGGFLAQRLFSCKDEKESVLAMLWFNLAHFALRPWPWIVVGVVSLFLIPDVTAYGSHFDEEHVYVIMLMKCLPTGLKGMMVAALIAAYMSTIATHVNFGASYLVNDLYKRFIDRSDNEARQVFVSQIASVVLAIFAGIYAYFSKSISDSWFLMFELMSGVGFVVLLRWYWWRISAWSELSAMLSSLILYYLQHHTRCFHVVFGAIGAPEYWLDEYAVRYTINMACSTVIWVTVTLVTPPEDEEHLIRFYNRVRPGGWWGHIAIKAGNPNHLIVGWLEWVSWALGVVTLVTMIMSLGKACFGLYLQSLAFAVVAAITTTMLFKLLGKMDWSAIETK